MGKTRGFGRKADFKVPCAGASLLRMTGKANNRGANPTTVPAHRRPTWSGRPSGNPLVHEALSRRSWARRRHLGPLRNEGNFSACRLRQTLVVLPLGYSNSEHDANHRGDEKG